MSYKRWLFTINNYTDVDVALFTDGGENNVQIDKRVFGDIRRSVFGKEVAPSSGTPHLQGYVEFSKRVSLLRIKALHRTAHWEPARGTSIDNYRYCVKDGLFYTYGDWSDIKRRIRTLNNKKNGTDQHASIMRNILDGNKENNWINPVYLRGKRNYDELANEVLMACELRKRFQRYSDKKLRKWQMSILRRLFVQNSRSILWVIDTVGGRGKTFLAHYISSCYGYELLDGVTKTADVAALISPQPKGVIFDVTRSDSTHFSYATLEAIKNGFVMSGKYHGIKRVFQPVPVIVFANFAPDTSKLSADRWDLYDADLEEETICKKEEIMAQETYPFCPPKEIPTFKENADDDDKDTSSGNDENKAGRSDPI